MTLADRIIAAFISPIQNLRANMLTTRFGERAAMGGGVHDGQDFAVPTGTPIYAPRDGIIKDVFWNQGGGNVAEIDHGEGLVTGYAHARNWVVKKGQQVKQGELIGYSGATGELVTGPHLHMYAEDHGRKVDPLSLFDELGDVPASIYRNTMDELASFFADSLKEDIGHRTWGQYANEINTDFGILGGSPGMAIRDRVIAAVNQLGWQDRTIEEADIGEFVATVAEIDPPTDPISAVAGAIGDIAGTIGAVVGFLLDPMNWARILALIAGGILTFVGFRSMWAASSGGVAPV